jgi:hypothetical protein
MEPLWLGLAAPKVFSAATEAGHAALRPFSAALELAGSLFDEPSASQSSSATLAATKNPHSSLLSELLTGQPLSGDGSIEIADVRTHADTLQDDLQRRIHDLLQQSGISLDEPVQLRISPIDGQLEVEGDAAQRALLEAALAGDPSLAADFRQLAAMRSLVAAADKHREFADSYSRDPYQAVNDFAELFDGHYQAQLQATFTSAKLQFE